MLKTCKTRAWIYLFKPHVSAWKMLLAQLLRLCAAAERHSGSRSHIIVSVQWRRARLEMLAICQAAKAMKHRCRVSQQLWKEPVSACAGLSPQAQQCPQAKRISFKAVPPGTLSQPRLWDVSELICSLRITSGTLSPSWFCSLALCLCTTRHRVCHLFRFFHHSLLV